MFTVKGEGARYANMSDKNLPELPHNSNLQVFILKN